MANLDIIQELNDLGSGLANGPFKVPYSVPEGYFEGLAEQLLELVRVSSLPKENPFQVPAGYFESLADSVMNKIHSNSHEQTPAEELASLSPLLSSITKEPVYSVPQGYFENFTVAVQEEQTAKVVSLSSPRKWMRYAAAAVLTGAIVTSGFFIFKSNKIDPDKNPGKWVESSMKKVNPSDVSEFVQLADQELPIKETVAATTKPEEIKELLKDVSNKEIDQFLSETANYEDSEDEMLLN